MGDFFALSGCLITYLLLAQRGATGRLNLREFWIRRARRLLPTVFLMIAVVVAWVTVFEPSRLAALRGGVLAATFYVSNWWNIAREASCCACFGPPPPLVKAKGFDGCYVVGLGTNDTANVYVGSVVGLDARIDQMMRVMGDQPVLWVTVRFLLTSGPYSEENMRLWNGALEVACSEYPNMRIFDWTSLTEDEWYIEDGSHYTSDGYRHRARLTANCLAHAFPASGDEESSSCVVR